MGYTNKLHTRRIDMNKVLITGCSEMNNYCYIYRHLKYMLTQEDVIYVGKDTAIDQVITTYARMNDIEHVIVDSVEHEVYTCDSLIVFTNGSDPDVGRLLLLAKKHKLTTITNQYKPMDLLISDEYVVHNKQAPHYDVYIGRGSKWGNPMPLIDEDHRLVCISEYAHYILNKPSLLNKLLELEGCILGCWCVAPKLCHGMVLRYLLRTYGEIPSSKAISSFRGEHMFLSNFSKAAIEYEDMLFPTVEHAYQAAKTLDREQRSMIAKTDSPVKAKYYGYKVDLRSDWNTIRFGIMRKLIAKKFPYGSSLANRLLDTGDTFLVEYNLWHDNEWGICTCGKCMGGSNNLGKLLMQQREELKTIRRNERYTKRLIVPIEGRPISLYTSTGTLVCTSYTRIVLGGRGPYVEVASNDLVSDNIIVIKEQKWRLNNDTCYYEWYTSLDKSDVKIYRQKRTVRYADYKIGYFYISPFDLYLEDGRVLIEKENRKL